MGAQGCRRLPGAGRSAPDSLMEDSTEVTERQRQHCRQLRGSVCGRSLGEEIGLTLFRGSQQFGEFGSSTELLRQRVGFERGVGAVVLFNGFFSKRRAASLVTKTLAGLV